MRKLVAVVVLASAVSAFGVEPPGPDATFDHWVKWGETLEDSARGLNHDLLDLRTELRQQEYALVECRDEVWRLKWDETKPAEHKPWWKRNSTYRLLLIGVAVGLAVPR